MAPDSKVAPAGLSDALSALVFCVAAFFAVTSISEFAVREQVLALLKAEKERASAQLLKHLSATSSDQVTVQSLERAAAQITKIEQRRLDDKA